MISNSINLRFNLAWVSFVNIFSHRLVVIFILIQVQLDLFVPSTWQSRNTVSARVNVQINFIIVGIVSY